MKTIYGTENMKCDNCVAKMKAKLSEVAGVQDVEANMTDKTMTITSDAPLSLDTLNASLADTKYLLTEK